MQISQLPLYRCAQYHNLKITIKTLLAVQFVCCLLISCTDDAQEKSPVIYVAGYERSTTTITQNQATIWENGSPTRLTDGSREAMAYSITVSGADVYAAGFEKNLSNISIAKYWKNGTSVNLTNGAWNAWATGIAIDGSDVYVSGYTTGFGANVALVWKNGTVQQLTDGTYEARAESVSVLGTDVYVAGWEYNDAFVSVAKYWKNGNEVVLSDGTVNAVAHSIVVSGQDTYVCGTDNGVATIWKNEEIIRLGTTGKTTVAYSLALADNGDVFAAGGDRTTGDKPIYWKNEIQTSLPASDPVIARSIFIFKNDIYAAGGGFAGGGRFLAQYWKNGAAIKLTNNNQDAFAYSIYVTQ